MKQDITAYELYHLLRELDFLKGGKIEQIYQEGKERITLVIHAQEKRFIHVFVGKLFFLGLHKGENPERPPGFCSYLRKYLKNARIQNISQRGFERIIDIELSTKEKTYHLIVELIPPGNVILCDEDYVILSPLTTANYADRVIRARVPYEHPQKEFNFLTLEEEQLNALITSTTCDTLVTSLAIDLGLGGLYAEEVCVRAKIDKDTKPSELTEDQKEMLFAALQLLRSQKTQPHLIKKSERIVNIIPIKLESKECEEAQWNTYWETLAHLLTQKKHEEVLKHVEKKANTKTRQLEERIKKQEQIIKGLQQSEEENQKIGEAIYENYAQLDELLKELNALREKGGWKAIKEKYPNLVVNEKTGEVTVDL
ncbi:hypothetical protein D6774_02085 [Candidatus Woesearchaeota archaeon]|nr:MAG: hypothetical protein D6774_02085 [Candidatus Woesearchaeota archaeon]